MDHHVKDKDPLIQKVDNIIFALNQELEDCTASECAMAYLFLAKLLENTANTIVKMTFSTKDGQCL